MTLAAALLTGASAAMALDPEALDLFDRGTRKAKSGDHRGAIEDFTKVLKIAPNDVAAYYHRALAIRLRQTDAELRALEES